MVSYPKPDVPKCVVFNFLSLEDLFFSKSFLFKKGLFLMVPVIRNTSFCVLQFAIFRKIALIFVTLDF